MTPCPTTAELDKLLDTDEGTALSCAVAEHLGACLHCQQALLRHGSRPGACQGAADASSRPNAAFLAGLKEKVRGELARTDMRHAIPGYELLERIGHGATAAVYRARHLSLDRVVP